MAHARSEHRNAITKLVNDKKIIMQKEVARRLNKTDIKGTVEILLKEGKFKRDKIKVRLSSGGLMEQYVLYSNKVKYEKVLDFEKKMINQPYESPLKEHHCYKKITASIEEEGNEIREVDAEVLDENVIDMQDYVSVNKVYIPIKEYMEQKVVTFKEIDMIHERPDGTAARNFKSNRKKFIEGEDYFLLRKSQKDEIRLLEIPQRGITVFTESGYLMLVKSFTDDLSWEVQRNLVKTYFRMKDIQEKSNNNLPITQEDFSHMKLMEMMFQEVKNQDKRLTSIENKLKLLA